ncbi:Xaa-Pro peptidase family protein [Fictibacillus enclensis]|uniref:M24 family metallopeptidase n=1 Tax=Fictibacillus enclensis TaxID=1017270 RepID=UPI0025A0F16A|nr:Xaa-Pro peptidase family protein [Fictibacillus enclensis]MDM5196737.1 Xaa-Pro peptidase family protein [Fictibacillus enclensis]
MAYQQRINKVQSLLEAAELEAVVITSPSNFFYFSGTWLDSHERLQAIVIPKSGKAVMVVHEMSKEEVQPGSLFDTVFWKDGDSSLALLAGILPAKGTVSIDNQWPSQNLLLLMKLRDQLSFVDSTNIIGKARLNKDQQEVDLLKSSGAVADTVMKQIINFIRPGHREKEVVDELKRLFAAQGVEELSFNPIVGTGRNGAIPHHQSDDTVIAEGDLVVIDMGGIKDHYCSDMTRTVLVGGEATQEMQKVYETVKRAHEEAVKAVKPGVPLKEIDLTAREIIAREGYGPYFTHRTGHGLGIDVHEEPFVTSNNDQLLEEGMVISIEPGIYLTGKFGVRIEDIVVVTATGSERFNHVKRDFINTVNGSIVTV